MATSSMLRGHVGMYARVCVCGGGGQELNETFAHSLTASYGLRQQRAAAAGAAATLPSNRMFDTLSASAMRDLCVQTVSLGARVMMRVPPPSRPSRGGSQRSP